MFIIAAVVLFGVLVFVHELGHFIFAKLSGIKVLKFSLGFGPEIVGFSRGETRYLISAIPLGGYVKMLGEEPDEELSDSDKERAFNYQRPLKRFIILFSGPFFNFLLTYIIFVMFLSYGIPINVPKLEGIKPVASKVIENSPAEHAGIKAGDKIVSVDGKDVLAWDEMAEIVMKNPGNELEMRVQRDGKTINLKITPKAEERKGLDGEMVTVGIIGIERPTLPFDLLEASSPLEAPFVAAEATYKMSFLVLKVVKQLVTGGLSIKAVGGPVTIFHESGRAAEVGILPYMMLMAFLSVNLGVINLLPIPILDGGHIMFVAIEAIKGKPLEERTMDIANRIGLAMLLTLLVVVTYNDITRYLVDDIVKFFNAAKGYFSGG